MFVLLQIFNHEICHHNLIDHKRSTYLYQLLTFIIFNSHVLGTIQQYKKVAYVRSVCIRNFSASTYQTNSEQLSYSLEPT